MGSRWFYCRRKSFQICYPIIFSLGRWFDAPDVEFSSGDGRYVSRLELLHPSFWHLSCQEEKSWADILRISFAFANRETERGPFFLIRPLYASPIFHFTLRSQKGTRLIVFERCTGPSMWRYLPADKGAPIKAQIDVSKFAIVIVFVFLFSVAKANFTICFENWLSQVWKRVQSSTIYTNIKELWCVIQQ